ncbi:MAG: hypothetical protein ACFFCS_03850 [Candidatus Hodarchaeota archaeon]
MKRKTIQLIAVLLVFMTTFQYLPTFARGAGSITPSQSKVKLLIFTQNKDGEFEIRMRLDTDAFDISYAVASTSDSNYYGNYTLTDFDCIIINSFLPPVNDSFFVALNDSVYTSGVGVFFLGGSYRALTSENTELSTLQGMLPVTFKDPFTVEEETYIDQSWVGQIELKVNDDYTYNSGDPNHFGVLQRNVVWESSPLVKERIFVEDSKDTSQARVLVYRPDINRKNTGSWKFTEGEPLVTYWQYGAGKVLFMSMGVGLIRSFFFQYEISGIGPEWRRIPIPDTQEEHTPSDGWNKPFYLWPYFNFFIYQSAMYLGGKSASNIQTYADWAYSPIPHDTEIVLWMTFVAGLWVFNFVLFFTLGRKKKREEEIKPIVSEEEKPKEDVPEETPKEDDVQPEEEKTEDKEE